LAINSLESAPTDEHDGEIMKILSGMRDIKSEEETTQLINRVLNEAYGEVDLFPDLQIPRITAPKASQRVPIGVGPAKFHFAKKPKAPVEVEKPRS
jgi:hypothetical protein